MDKKEIIYELAKGVQTVEFDTSAKYGGVRRKLSKHGISEIGLYSVIAEYLEGNSIHPHRFIKETAYAFRKVSENPFSIRTDKELSYLYHRFESIKVNELDNKKFLCNKCFRVLSVALKSSGKNYPSTCSQCRKREANKHYHENKDKNKSNDKENKDVTIAHDVPTIDKEPLITEQELEMLTQPTATEIEQPIGINIDTISGDGDTTLVSVMVPTARLADYLELIKEHMDN